MPILIILYGYGTIVDMRLRDASKVLHYDTKKKAKDKKARLTKTEASTGFDWKKGVQEPVKSKYLVYLTIGTFLFFVTAVATAYFVQYAGIDRTISTSKIAITTQGATSVNNGSAVPLTIRIANRNPVPVQGVSLVIGFPRGTYKEEEGGAVTLWRREELFLDTIQKGEILNKHITPIFYGTSGEEKEIIYTLKYDVAGVAESSQKNESYAVVLRESPVRINTLQYTTPTVGKEVSFTTTIQSNSPSTPAMTFVNLRYPSGFTPKTFSLRPFSSAADSVEWRFSDLQPGTEETIVMSGTIHGADQEQQAVSVEVLVSPTGNPEDAVVVADAEDILTVGKAFFGMRLALNGAETGRIVASPGETVRADVRWLNQDTARINGLVITATVTGTGLDESSIEPKDGGYFDELQRTIVWDRKSVDSFSSVGAGRGGVVSFEFQTLPDRIEFSEEQKYIRIALSARAMRSETGNVEEVQDASVGRVSLRSVLQVAANTLYATSVVKNSGPLPPQVGKTTTYTLKYFIKNSGNEVSDVLLKVPLGQKVVLTEATAGVAGNEWRYDKEEHAVYISLASLTARGPQSSRSIEMQVAVKPEPDDVDGYITLAGRGAYSAFDAYAGESIAGTTKRLTTQIVAEKVEETEVTEYRHIVEEDVKREIMSDIVDAQ